MLAAIGSGDRHSRIRETDGHCFTSVAATDDSDVNQWGMKRAESTSSLVCHEDTSPLPMAAGADALTTTAHSPSHEASRQVV